MGPHADEAPEGLTARVVVTVVRTGGIAGMRKQWRAEPPAFESPRWIALIDECPWDDCSREPGRGADRYVWSIQAERGDDTPREAELPDSRLDGPWRTLVAEVQEAAPPTHRPSGRV